MDGAVISALAAVGGSSVGALTPVLSNYLLQRSVTRRDFRTKELADRQTLYSDFISEATRLYADALTSSVFKVSDVVGIYALVSRIRLIAPDTAVLAAEAVVTTIVERYGQDNLTLEDLSKAALSVKLDQLHQFSTTCRQDLSKLALWNR